MTALSGIPFWSPPSHPIIEKGGFPSLIVQDGQAYHTWHWIDENNSSISVTHTHSPWEDITHWKSSGSWVNKQELQKAGFIATRGGVTPDSHRRMWLAIEIILQVGREVISIRLRTRWSVAVLANGGTAKWGNFPTGWNYLAKAGELIARPLKLPG